MSKSSSETIMHHEKRALTVSAMACTTPARHKAATSSQGRRQSASATGTQTEATTQTAASASSALCAAAAWRMTGTIASKTPAATAARAAASLTQLMASISWHAFCST